MKMRGRNGARIILGVAIVGALAPTATSATKNPKGEIGAGKAKTYYCVDFQPGVGADCWNGKRIAVQSNLTK